MARRPRSDDSAITDAMNPDTEVPDDITRFIDGLDVAGLTRVISLATAKRHERLAEAKKALIERTKAEAEQLGLSMDDLFPRVQPRTETRTRKSPEPKYRDPETGETWSGRGRLPSWLQKAEGEGKSRDEFLIDKPSQPELPDAAG